jgi:hypothetical protein
MDPRRFLMTTTRLPFFAIEDEDGGAAFVEQPGDREPEGEAPEPEAGTEPEPEAEPEEEAPAEEPEASAEPEAESEPEAEPEAEPEPAPKKPSWKDRQIIKLRQQLKEKDTELAKVRTPTPEPAPEGEAAPPQPDREQVKAEVRAEMEREQRFKTINQRSDAMYDAGAKDFPKTWTARVNEAAEALGQEIVDRPEFLETLTELPNAAAVYHELAGDLDNMERVLALPAAKMGLELAQMSAKLATPKPKPAAQSKAPAPIRPIERPAQDELALDDPNLTQDEFNRRMDRLEEAKFAARR